MFGPRGQPDLKYLSIIEATSTLKTAKPFGEVSDTFLIIDGYLLDATLRFEPEKTSITLIPKNMAIQDCTNYLDWHLYLDTVVEIATTATGFINVKRSTRAGSRNMEATGCSVPARVKCLKVRTVEAINFGRLLQLLVLGGSARVLGAYERLGYLHLYVSGPYEFGRGMPPEVITKVKAWFDTSNMQKIRIKLV